MWEVQFHWQANTYNPGRATADHSCWLRVMQRSAGAGAGHQHIPRIGQEVLVGFLSNDIDRTFVWASLYNGQGEGGVPATPGGQDAPADTSGFASSTDHRPSAQMNLIGSGVGGNSPAWHGAAPGSAAEGQEGQNNAAALSGIKSKELGGNGYNQLVFNDTPNQLRTQLHSTQSQTWLQIGHLLHQANTGEQMKSFALHLLLATSLISGCHAGEREAASSPPASSAQATEVAASGAALRDEIFRRAREHNGGKEPTKLELLNELMGKAQEEVGAVKDYGKPRAVARGGSPEISVQGEKVVVNGTSLLVGISSVDDWRAVLGPENRRETGAHMIYLWDRLGIALLVRGGRSKVTQLAISLNLEPKEPWNPKLPDGSTMPAPPDYNPKNPFPGYLELDGYGIDAQTKFWEIRVSADPKRNLRCNQRDCSHPHGGFSDRANLYLRLNGATEYGSVYEFTIIGR